MPKHYKRYEDSLDEALQDPVRAAAYLNAALEEINEPDGMALFLMSLGDVLRARGVSQVAKNAKLGRASTYKSLSAAGNPKLKNLLALLHGLGLRLQIDAPAPEKPSARKSTPAHARDSKRRTQLAKAS